MKLKSIAALTAALSVTGMSLAHAADPVGVFASKTKGKHIADYTTDNQVETRWSAKGAGEFIQYKFQDAVTLEAIDIAFFKGISRTSTFRIESTDRPWKADAVWQQQELMQSSGTTNELERFTLAEPVTAKYFRIVNHGFVGKKGWKSNLINITEVNFIDEEVIHTATCDTTASGHDGNMATYATDKNIQTHWSAQGSNSLTVELCAKEYVSAVDIAFDKGDIQSAYFDIQTSTDGYFWQDAAMNQMSSGESSSFERFEVEGNYAQYIRFVGHGNSNDEWNSLLEIAAVVSENPEIQIFKDNQLRWQASAIENYQYTYKKSCFCGPDGSNEIQVTVVNGEVQSALNLTTETLLSAEETSSELTIEDWFSRVQSTINKTPDSLNIDYAENGRLTRLDVDLVLAIADEEYSYSLYDFKANTPVDLIAVYKSTERIQCEVSGLSIEETASYLTDEGINVTESHCAYSTDYFHLAVCGAGTNEINVHIINASELSDAESLGFKPTSSFEDGYKVTQCK